MNPLAVAGHSWLIFSLFACIAEGSLQMPSFQPGILYQYRYSLDAQLGYVPRVSLQGSWMKAEALVHVQLLWRSQAGEQLLQVQIQNLKFSHEPEHEKNQNATGGPFTETTLGKENTAELQLPVFLHWNNGKVEGIYGDREEKPLILDLKRGLISLLQFQPHAGRITEEDISGSCKVAYTVSKDSVVKTKDLQECTRPRFGFTSVNKLKDYLKTVGNRRVRMDISKVSTTWQFHRLIQMLHSAKKRDVLQLLRKASEKTVPFFIDAAVAAQSTASLVALSEFLDFSNKKQEPLVEKFLYAAAFSPRPSKELLRLLLDKLNGKQLTPAIWKTGIIVTGSLVGKLCRMKLCGLQEVELGMETVLRRLSETEEESEMVTYLLSLKNALLPETIPILLNYAEEGSAAVSGTAVSALQRFSTQHITGEVKKAMRRIFHEKMRKYEKTCRLTAAEILLDNEPLPMDITNILLATRELETEMATFLLSKIQSSLHSPHHPSRKAMKELLKDPWINNYSYLSKAGISSSFSGPLTVTKDVLFPFTLDLLFTEVGLLRKSVSDFLLLSHGHQLQAAQVTFEAKGLDSVLGENTNEEEEEELMAGMSAIVFDVQLRPVVFFQGYTDLMAKVLLSSGEPTNVIKGNVLLMDHQQAIPLQSGLQAVVELQGGLGIDISANIDVNIWEQESKTEIRTRGGLAIDFQAELDAPFFQASLRRQTEVETALNFATALRFSGSPMLMCLQLNEEQLPYREIFTISETSVNRSITVRKGRRGMLAGRDFALHTANSEMCKILLAEEKEQ